MSFDYTEVPFTNISGGKQSAYICNHCGAFSLTGPKQIEHHKTCDPNQVLPKENPNEICEICGGFAGFETSPEGEKCDKCDRWICNDCVEFSMSGEEQMMCQDCAEEEKSKKQ